MANIEERLEKQMEGTNLALAAVAEVLQKMDGRLVKEADEEEEEVEKAAIEKAQSNLVTSVASEVVSMLKANAGDSYAGADISGNDRKASPTGSTPQNADDSESNAAISSKIEEQQNTIQAADMSDDEDEMEKAYQKGYTAAMKKGHDDEDEDGIDKADDKADDESADEVVAEKGMDEEDDDMDKMQKQIESLKKQIANTESNMQKAVQSESEGRLRKMGFREETGLQAPKIVNGLGVDGSTPLQKAAAADTPAQLAELSYSELRRMQHQIDSGNTEGIPRELLGN
tara:strand:+ start:952 stop:1809 length:858 start_codon:yes stop_codon:yes gene_type:complete